MAQLAHPECLAQEDLRRLSADKSNRVLVIDVRSPEEYNEGHIPAAINIPLQDLPDGLTDAGKDTRVVTVCGKGGGLSAAAAGILKANGYRHAQYLCGGTLGWPGIK